LQGTAPLTDLGYAGMFFNADSGLYLTQYRAYDPVSGRWLTRDPIGEVSDPAANLYQYVNGNPVGLIDPRGEFGLPGAALGAAVGGLAAGAADLAWQYQRNGGSFRCFSPLEFLGAAGVGAGIGALIGGTGGLGLLAAAGGVEATTVPVDLEAVRMLAGYELAGGSALIGDTYTMTIWSLYNTGGGPGLWALSNAIRAEAAAAGASNISITGTNIVNPGFSSMSSALAARLGWTITHIDGSTILITGPVL
jgi:RHS repeat-associated protein